jgi:hypothetical protein
MTAPETQWWLARLDQHGNPTLCDGAHSERAGADRAFYLFGRLKLSKDGERYAVAEVRLSEPVANPQGVDESAINILNAARRP